MPTKTLKFRPEAIDKARGNLFSVERLAGLVGRTRQTIDNWRKGRVEPGFSDICRLASALGQPLEFFTEEERG